MEGINIELTPESLRDMIESLSPSGYLDVLDRDRPYDGQPHTCLGERGKTEVRGLTMRDIRDCFIRASFECSLLPPDQWPKSIYDLDWDNIDPLALFQNMVCWIERYMGIYPNVSPLLDTSRK